MTVTFKVKYLYFAFLSYFCITLLFVKGLSSNLGIAMLCDMIDQINLDLEGQIMDFSHCLLATVKCNFAIYV